MKILFAVQGTGNGHISRAREVIPHLLDYGDLDVLISGTQAEVTLPYLIKFKRKGISYTFGKKGGIDFMDSIRHFRPFHFLKDILTFPVHGYDLVINDFEPVTAWACRLKHKPCIGLSHQSSFLSPNTPRPEKRDWFAENVFRKYAPVSAYYGFHFKSYDHHIHTPVIRNEVRQLGTMNKEHITVYLPAHGDEILISHLKQVQDIQWEVFSKHSKISYAVENVNIYPITSEAFVHSLATGNGLLTAGGFESPAEAIFLRKKVMTIPMFNQYEQLCNAEAMKDLGVTVVQQIDTDFVTHLKGWIRHGSPSNIHYPDRTAEIVEKLMLAHSRQLMPAV